MILLGGKMKKLITSLLIILALPLVFLSCGLVLAQASQDSFYIIQDFSKGLKIYKTVDEANRPYRGVVVKFYFVSKFRIPCVNAFTYNRF
jgi:hypothetical protein